LFRAVEAWSPALLIDEADTFLRNNDELRGIINSGHTRDLAFVIRTVGDDHEPRRFSTWGAKAIASIGKLSDTNADRSIEICLKRKLPGEPTEKLRHADPETFNALARRCARWAADHIDEIRAARPSMPAGLHDRAEDNWEPLLAIADLAGGKWPKRAREAASALLGGDEDTGGLGVELLGDIRVVFEDRSVDRISSEDLVLALVGLKERRWAEYSRGKPLTMAKLARLLRPYGVVSGTIRLPDGKTPKGYLLDRFTDPFARYLPAYIPPTEAPHRHNVDWARVSEDFESATAGGCGASENGPEPRRDAGCGGVADSTHLPGGHAYDGHRDHRSSSFGRRPDRGGRCRS
jgi:putative DNA primase/helicase